MKSIERRFEKIRNKYPDQSDYICFVEAITNQNFSRERIRRHFNNLINKNEYLQKEKRQILNHLYEANDPNVEFF